MYVDVSPASELTLQTVLNGGSRTVGLLQRYLPIHADVHLDGIAAAYTPRAQVMEWLEQGIDVILEIDVQGALQVQKNYDDGVYIFILPPSLEELKKRIRGRGSETEETMARRLGEALHEIHNIDKYDYRVINEDLDTAIDRVRAIITAEQCKINGEEVDWIVNKYKEDL